MRVVNVFFRGETVTGETLKAFSYFFGFTEVVFPSPSQVFFRLEVSTSRSP